jgi:DNA-binding winged helix-turn-helix (wHTH) protein
MRTSSNYQLGGWTFDPAAQELRSSDSRVRLEQRASIILALLCERMGEVVSQAEMIERAWNGRHLSPNSVAVVISDLRRALKLPANTPGSIETVPKAGYRLVRGDSQQGATAHNVRLRWAFAALVLSCAGAFLLLHGRASSPTPRVVFGAIENAMGTDRHAALMQACSDSVLVELRRQCKRVRIVQASAQPIDRGQYVLLQRWVLWSGDPELVLVATDSSDQIFWSGAIYGPEDEFPAKIAAKVAEFTAAICKN